MTAEKITLTHPYRLAYVAAWMLFSVLLIWGYAQGQSFFILILGILAGLAAVYTFYAATQLQLQQLPEPAVIVLHQPLPMRPRTFPLNNIASFSTNANRPQLADDDEHMGYHRTRPIAYQIFAEFKNGRSRFLAEAHTEATALDTVKQLNQQLSKSKIENRKS